MLRFRADHASAQDAVFTDVLDEILANLNNILGSRYLKNSR